MFGGKLGDLTHLLKNAGKIQELMKDTQEKLSKIEVMGESGAGAVKIRFNAQNYAKAVMIDDEILKEDKTILLELIAAAINDGAQKIEKEREKIVTNPGMLGGMLTDDVNSRKE